MSKIVNGMFEWVDLSTPDVEDARRFYGDLLGWRFEVQQSPMGEYSVVVAGGREVAGMMVPAPGAADAPPMWTVFVRVDDMETTTKTIAEAGGSVLAEPFEIPGGARVGVVADRTGAMFALIADGPQPDDEYFADTPGAVCWVELMSGDVAGAIEFYREVFGWVSETAPAGPTPYTVARLDDREVAGIIGRTPGLPAEAPDSWSVYFTVDDCAAVSQRATELGGAVLLPPTPTPMGPFAVLADRQGAAFQIMEMASEGDAAARS